MAVGQKKGGKLAQVVNYRVKVTLNDTRNFTGTLLAFDKHMNLVLAECEEFRRVKSKKSGKAADDGDMEDEEEEMKRTLGLVILRGETIVSLQVIGAPTAAPEQTGPVRRTPLARLFSHYADLVWLEPRHLGPANGPWLRCARRARHLGACLEGRLHASVHGSALRTLRAHAVVSACLSVLSLVD